MMPSFLRTFALPLIITCAAATTVAQERRFVHPGILHTRGDLYQMKELVAAGAEPWASGFKKLRAHPQSSSSWTPRGPFEVVTRGRGENVHNSELATDANAAYQNALMYWFTGEEGHARTAIEVLDAWCSTLRTIGGHDKQLAAGLYGFKLVAAAELMRYSDFAWDRAKIEQAVKMFREVLYPVIRDFATFANGNWDGACMKAMMAIGVFCDDREIFDRAVKYYFEGSGNGRITHYVVNEDGQCQESGRDQAHTQLGLGLLAECCEIGWIQGVDMYGAADNRLLRGYEYTARYNLGSDVPFTPFTDTTGKYAHKEISARSRGRFRAVWEIAWNHYHGRMGLDMPQTREVIEKIRPEGAAFQTDHPGFGTLLFGRPAPTGIERLPRLLELDGDIRLHDPAVTREDGTYYIFSTGGGRRRRGILPIRSSKDLRSWARRGAVFERLPEWATREIPRARGAWAPDVSYFAGRFHVYYSVSTFGRNDSAIGLVTNETLDPSSPGYAWVDRGMVVRSTQGKDDWNAIDPNLVVEDADRVWLSWGSFWDGIKMRRIDPATGLLSSEDATLYSLARRPRGGPGDTKGAVEAPFIVRHDDQWFLFVSFDFCCRGARSTYRIVVGRASEITGPYVDADGTPLLSGGGTTVLEATTPRWRGPGHCDVLTDANGDYLVFHAYHGRTGRPELKISTLVWTDGWPRAAELP